MEPDGVIVEVTLSIKATWHAVVYRRHASTDIAKPAENGGDSPALHLRVVALIIVRRFGSNLAWLKLDTLLRFAPSAPNWFGRKTQTKHPTLARG